MRPCTDVPDDAGDRRLLDGMRGRDEAALGEFTERHARQVMEVVRRVLGSDGALLSDVT